VHQTIGVLALAAVIFVIDTIPQASLMFCVTSHFLKSFSSGRFSVPGSSATVLASTLSVPYFSFPLHSNGSFSRIVICVSRSHQNDVVMGPAWSESSLTTMVAAFLANI